MAFWIRASTRPSNPAIRDSPPISTPPTVDCVAFRRPEWEAPERWTTGEPEPSRHQRTLVGVGRHLRPFYCIIEVSPGQMAEAFACRLGRIPPHRRSRPRDRAPVT